jgi:RNA polymerase sigma factor for flagellar operon FliA
MFHPVDPTVVLPQDLALRMMPTIRRIASQLARRLPRHIRVDDLVGAGCQGLCSALGRFDPSRAEGFESYAELRIRGAMLDELRSSDPLSRDQRVRAKRVAAATRGLQARLGRAPAADEIAAELGVSLETLWAWQSAASTQIASGPSRDEDADPIAELSDAAAEPADEKLFRTERERALRDAMSTLPARLQTVLELHYVDGLTLREIGERLGVSESRVCQLESDAFRRIREQCREEAAVVAPRPQARRPRASKRASAVPAAMAA